MVHNVEGIRILKQNIHPWFFSVDSFFKLDESDIALDAWEIFSCHNKSHSSFLQFSDLYIFKDFDNIKIVQ